MMRLMDDNNSSHHDQHHHLHDSHKEHDCDCHNKKEHGCCCCQKEKHECNEKHGCTGLCKVFEKMSPGTTIRVVTTSGDVIEGNFISLNEDPYVIIEVSSSFSPYQQSELVYVDLEKIESITLVLH